MFMYLLCIYKNLIILSLFNIDTLNFTMYMLATSKTWTRTLDPDPEKPGPLKTWTQKNLDPEKIGSGKNGKNRTNIRLKNMSDFRESCFIKTMRNVIYWLKVHVVTDN